MRLRSVEIAKITREHIKWVELEVATATLVRISSYNYGG